MCDMNFKRCLIIAEAGVNHNGDVNLALQLCDAAKEPVLKKKYQK